MLSSRVSAASSSDGRMTAVSRLLFTTFTLLVFSVSALAQSTTGRILGTLTDQSGAAVAGATVVVTDVQRGTSRTATTDESGAYAAPDLQPGTYKIHVEAKGFKSVERPNVQIEVVTDVRADFALQPGQVTETVTISEEVPLVNTTSATLGGTLSNKEINDLPLNGRNYENLLQLRPGIMRYPGGGFSTTSSNGLRAEDNAYLVDGLFNSEPFSGQSIINGAGIAGDSATILPVDAIQEFNVQQNPSAEYGWKPGTIVNVALKSGTNNIHGTAYAFGRDTPLDARNWFNTVASGPKNPRNLEQFGATAGGAIVKDQLFFFGAFERQNYTVGNSGFLSTPATVSLGGDPNNSVVDAIAAVQAAGITPSPASLKIAGCTVGPPISCDGSGFPTNNGTNPQGATLIPFGLPNSVSSDNAVAKVDDHLNDRNSLTFMYFFGDNSGTVSDASQLQTKWLTQIHTRAQVFGTSWTWTPTSNWVNEARFGYNRLYQPTFTNDHNTNIASTYGLNTGVTNPLYGGLPRISVFPFYIFPQEFGGFNWPKVQGPDTREQFIDHISYIRGKHAIKFGGELHRDAFSGGAYGGSRGRIKFIGGETMGGNSNGMEDFFAGAPTNATLLIGDPTRQIHSWGFAGFAQLAGDKKSHRKYWIALRAEHGDQGSSQSARQLRSYQGIGSGGPERPQRSLQWRPHELRPALRLCLGRDGQRPHRRAWRRRHHVRNVELGIVPRAEQLPRLGYCAHWSEWREPGRRHHRDRRRLLSRHKFELEWNGIPRQQHDRLQSGHRFSLHRNGHGPQF
jgi:hypothetical protein